MPSQSLNAGKPLWLTGIATFGILWNSYGVYQFAGSFSQNTDTLMRGGLSPAQAVLYLSLPAWMDIAFGIGVFGGLSGSIALLLGRAVATTILGISLVAYLLLFAGDAAYGLFAIPSQFAILSFVVATAIVVFASAVTVRRRMMLV